MQPRISIQWRAVSIPKSSHKLDANEDAFSPYINQGEFLTNTFFQCAVADGATRSSFSRIFAESLVSYCSSAEKSTTLQDVIQSAREEWYRAISAGKLNGSNGQVVQDGAYSTLLWLQLFTIGTDRTIRNNSWKAKAVGDTCLFHYRKEYPLRILPVNNSIDFTNHPRLIGSNKSQVHTIAEWEFSGSWDVGDDFFILTDSIAKWMLQEVESGGNPSSLIKEVFSFKDANEKFELWVQSLRARNKVRDDDTTVVWINIQ